MANGAPDAVGLVAAAIFALAVLHTFSTRSFERLAHIQPRHAGLWRLLAEVEVVFGFWAAVLIAFMVVKIGKSEARAYLESRNFTEPAFVFVIMVIAASRPVIDLAAVLLRFSSLLIPVPQPTAYYFTLLSIGPLLGSFITEPAAMTLTALLLKRALFRRECAQQIHVRHGRRAVRQCLDRRHAHALCRAARAHGRGALGLRSSVHAPDVRMEGSTCCGSQCRPALRSYSAIICARFPTRRRSLAKLKVPSWVAGVHIAFLAAVVAFNHHPIVFLALFMFFLGFAEAYKRFQSPLILREGLLVAFFLAGLVVIGGQQKWWLQPLLVDMEPKTLFTGATLLTAITDNAALTYLGSLVEGVSDEFKYSLVAGAVTGGGLTVIANAPNPAGFAILKNSFEDGTISAGGLVAAALIPTLVAAAAFQLLP